MSLSYTTGNPNNLTAGATASMNDIQGPFTDIKTFLTDGSGAVGDTILASPNNAAWETVLASQTVANALGSAGSFYFSTNGANLSGSGSSLTVQGLWVPPAAADIAVAGKTTRLRLRVAYVTNATAAGVAMTWGLYPVTASAGGASVANLTLGTVVTGSTAAVTPSASTANHIDSGSFDASLVTAGSVYIIGLAIGANMAAGSLVNAQVYLEMRHT